MVLKWGGKNPMTKMPHRCFGHTCMTCCADLHSLFVLYYGPYQAVGFIYLLIFFSSVSLFHLILMNWKQEIKLKLRNPNSFTSIYILVVTIFFSLVFSFFPFESWAKDMFQIPKPSCCYHRYIICGSVKNCWNKFILILYVLWSWGV